MIIISTDGYLYVAGSNPTAGEGTSPSDETIKANYYITIGTGTIKDSSLLIGSNCFFLSLN